MYHVKCLTDICNNMVLHMFKRYDESMNEEHDTTIILFTPYDIYTSQIVCDFVREGYIVICNLTNTDKNQRVVDYISGGVYSLGGKVVPTLEKTTFICTPATVSIYAENDDGDDNGISFTRL